MAISEIPIAGMYDALMPNSAIILSDSGFLPALRAPQPFLKFRNMETSKSIKEIICFTILIENISL